MSVKCLLLIKKDNCGIALHILIFQQKKKQVQKLKELSFMIKGNHQI